ncbi:MAG: putative UDP-N-acetylmuramoylalanine--D-glutamate ligase [Candidatus Saccharibacteria bacterium]|nr:putative UDP-N-acetylmuramoylalanine--D-glutamate ligase [Candidatus Saccharibacteria bacterium]
MNIAILGYGIEGESVYTYYRAKFPDAKITAYDNHEQPKNPLPADVDFIGRVKDFKNITADIAIKTPAIAPWLVEVSGEVTTATREFMKRCPAPIIGVTGTKGKGTTSSLIKSILDAAGKKTWLVGNIGIGALDVLDQIKADDIVIYELSSFQLWDSDVSPHIAVVLFIEQEHLDVHTSMEDYVNAKANIALYQTEDDTVIYDQSNYYSKKIAMGSSARQIEYPTQQFAHIENDFFYYGEQRICSTNVLKIKGAHNQMNACAAIDAVWEYTQNLTAIEKGLSDFTGLPHRLELVAQVNGVTYYDDSIATTPSAAIAALRSFKGHKVIILGGSSKGSDFNELANELNKHDVDAILIGEEAAKIAACCDQVGFKNYEIIEDITMDSVVRRASELAKIGSTVLLSPASASFGLFKNYVDRGEQFSRAVSALNEAIDQV